MGYELYLIVALLIATLIFLGINMFINLTNRKEQKGYNDLYKMLSSKIDNIEREVESDFHRVKGKQDEEILDLKLVKNDMRKMEIDLVRIQTILEERAAKPQEMPQLTYKNGPGRPPKVLKE